MLYIVRRLSIQSHNIHWHIVVYIVTYGQLGSTNAGRDAQDKWQIAQMNIWSLILYDEWRQNVNSNELLNKIMGMKHLDNIQK